VSEDAVRALVHRARSKLRGAAGMLLPPLQEHLSVPPAPDAVTPVARAIAVLVAGAIIATPLTVLHHHSRGERDLAQSAPTAALVQPPLGGTDWSSRCCMRNSRAVPGSRHVSAPRLRADVRAGAGSPSGVSPTERSALSSGSAGALRGGGGGTVGGSGTEDSSGDPTEPTLNAGGALAPVGEAVGGVASTTDSLRNEVASRVPDAPGVVAGAVSSAEEVAGSLSGALPAQLP
jgi:hypothetical protein